MIMKTMSDSSFEDAEDIEKEDEGLNYQGELYKFVYPVAFFITFTQLL